MSSEGPWEAGAIGRIPDDDSLVYRGDAVTGTQFYARTPEDAEQATRALNDLESRLDVVRTVYKRLVERGGNELTYGEWAQVGDAVDPIPGRPVSPEKAG